MRMERTASGTTCRGMPSMRFSLGLATPMENSHTCLPAWSRCPPSYAPAIIIDPVQNGLGLGARSLFSFMRRKSILPCLIVTPTTSTPTHPRLCRCRSQRRSNAARCTACVLNDMYGAARGHNIFKNNVLLERCLRDAVAGECDRTLPISYWPSIAFHFSNPCTISPGRIILILLYYLLCTLCTAHGCEL